FALFSALLIRGHHFGILRQSVAYAFAEIAPRNLRMFGDGRFLHRDLAIGERVAVSVPANHEVAGPRSADDDAAFRRFAALEDEHLFVEDQFRARGESALRIPSVDVAAQIHPRE